MKKLLSIVFLFVFFLFSCAPNTTPNATATSIATATSTITPIPTSTPTITPTPTNTPDPNMPAGAMGRDENGYYKDVQENGKTVRYYWVDYNYGIKEWFTSHILDGNLLNGGIPLLDGDLYGRVTVIGGPADFGGPSMPPLLPFYFYTQEGLQAPFMQHPQNLSQPGANDFSNNLFYYLQNNYLDIVRTPWKITSDKSQQFRSDFVDGKISFPFTTPFGNYVWRPTKTIGYKFYGVKWDDADPAIHPEFYETSWGGHSWRWTIFSDTEGNLIVLVTIYLTHNAYFSHRIFSINQQYNSKYKEKEIQNDK